MPWELKTKRRKEKEKAPSTYPGYHHLKNLHNLIKQKILKLSEITLVIFAV